jgi:hypothetical protein
MERDSRTPQNDTYRLLKSGLFECINNPKFSFNSPSQNAKSGGAQNLQSALQYASLFTLKLWLCSANGMARADR